MKMLKLIIFLLVRIAKKISCGVTMMISTFGAWERTIFRLMFGNNTWLDELKQKLLNKV